MERDVHDVFNKSWDVAHDCYEKLSGSDPTVHGHFKAVAWNF